MRELTGKTALITGASRGIGAEIAAALAREGVRPILVARSRPALEQVAERIAAEGHQVHLLQADLARTEALEPLVRDALALGGRIDILVNNAATSCFLPFHRYVPADLEREMSTNLLAPLLLTRQVLPHMLSRGSGHIVNLSSLSAEVPVAYLSTYAAAKAGLTSFTRTLRQELVGTGVGVSAVLPGVVRDVGLIRDFAQKSGYGAASHIAGSCTSAQVARAVLDAIRRDRPDVVVNSRPVRPLLALMRLMPGTFERILRVIGFQKMFADAVAFNVRSGGSLMGVGIAPDAREQARAAEEVSAAPSAPDASVAPAAVSAPRGSHQPWR